MNKPLFEAIATLVGMIIGAGILGIPYVVSKSGFIVGAIDIVLIGSIFLFINLYLGEIVLRTKGDHQLTGYAELYAGKPGRWLMSFSIIFGMTGAIVAYITKVGEFLNILLQPSFGGSHLLYSLIFFLMISYLIYKGLHAVEKSELYMVSLILLITVIVFIAGIRYIDMSNLAGFSPQNFFLPFGVIMFAFLGTAAIPELREELKQHRHLMKKAIIIGSLIPVAVYLIFALIVLGISGPSVTDDAMVGLGQALGPSVLVLGILFGTLTMSTSFLAIGLALKEAYMFDFRLKKKTAFFLACYVPLIISMIIILSRIGNAFFKVIDVTGIISGAIVGFLIVPMLRNARKIGQRAPEYSLEKSRMIEVAIIVVFALGVIFELVRILH